MKKSKWWASLSLALVMSTGLAVAVGQSDKVMQRQSDGTYVVNTVTLCPTVRGFKGATPLFVYIKGGKVVKVEAQRNQESPKFFQKVRQGLLPKFAGMKLSTAANASEVDGVTGATMSSRAVKKNVAAAEKPYGRRTSRPVLMRSEPGVASVVCVVEATEPVVLRATESRLSGPH